jgi:hypothetical protein
MKMNKGSPCATVTRSRAATRYTCYNPFKEDRHQGTKCLRYLSRTLRKKVPSIPEDVKVCDKCRKRISTLPDHRGDSSSSDSVQPPAPPSPQAVPLEVLDEARIMFGHYLEEIGESPIKKRKIHQKKYRKDKCKKIKTAIKTFAMGAPSVESTSSSDHDTRTGENEYIQQLKERFASCREKSEQLQILSVLPKSWPLGRIENEFGVSNYMARKVKELVREKGIFATPNARLGKTLPKSTADLVRAFYVSDDVSRPMPGMKDSVSMKVDGIKTQVQKRLILNNLKEIYHQFKEEHTETKIGFSKFAELRPKNCILAGASGTHTVCVCTIHQNVILMMSAAKIAEMTKEYENPLTNYRSCLDRLICTTPQSSCYLGECDECPGIETFQQELRSVFDEEMVDTVVYREWVSVDRTTLRTECKGVNEFVDIFCARLHALLRHSFIATSQAKYQKQLKNNLIEGEVLVICDFSENYSFVMQDAAQGYHWNNAQATVHPFVAYFKENSELKHTSFVVISECLRHDTVAVHLFKKKMIEHLNDTLPFIPAKVYYFSDGAASQYKNRFNFLNLCLHEEDFGMPAEWHFTATSHGKGACDGVGGTVKRLAARASLQRPYGQQIMTPRDLFAWAKESIPSVAFAYTTIADHDAEESYLKDRFLNARAIAGTQKLHAFIPISKDRVQTKVFSLAPNSKIEKVSLLAGEILLSQMQGYVTCVHNNQWWVGCVLSTDEESATVAISLLKPSGHHPPRKNFTYNYPTVSNLQNIPANHVLTKVDPSSKNVGKHYTLTPAESASAAKEFKKWLKTAR